MKRMRIWMLSGLALAMAVTPAWADIVGQSWQGSDVPEWFYELLQALLEMLGG